MNFSNVRVFSITFVLTILALIGNASAQIVALGHSAVRGGVAENQMWPAVLEGMLHARGSQVHVTNAGVWGETTGSTLARTANAVPAGTKIVILATNQHNDALKLPEGAVNAAANIAAIKSQLRARGITIIDAMGLYISVLRQPGMALPDNRHLSVEGNRAVAARLAAML